MTYSKMMFLLIYCFSFVTPREYISRSNNDLRRTLRAALAQRQPYVVHRDDSESDYSVLNAAFYTNLTEMNTNINFT